MTGVRTARSRTRSTWVRIVVARDGTQLCGGCANRGGDSKARVPPLTTHNRSAQEAALSLRRFVEVPRSRRTPPPLLLLAFRISAIAVTRFNRVLVSLASGQPPW